MTELMQLLLDCLKKDCPVDGRRLTTLGSENWHALLQLAADQRVRPLLWHRLKQKGLAELLPADIAAEFQEAFRRNTVRNLRHYGELASLLAALKPEGIPLILLKGIYLADTVYESMALREMTDIDLLVCHTDLKRVADILAGMGYTSCQLICPEITLATGHHLPAMMKGGLKFEIHWSLTRPGTSYSIDPACLWERAIPCRIAGREARALSPADLLLHLCLHTSYQHQFVFGLRPFCDIAATIEHFGAGFDWQVVFERADCWGWRRGVYLALRLAKDLVGAAVPATILDQLVPADMTEDILSVARAQVFSDKLAAAAVPESLAALLASPGLLEKIRIFWQRTFLPKASIAAVYAVPPDSVMIYWCYPRRIFDLLRRHRHVLTRYHQDDDGRLHAMVARKNSLATWLSG